MTEQIGLKIGSEWSEESKLIAVLEHSFVVLWSRSNATFRVNVGIGSWPNDWARLIHSSEVPGSNFYSGLPNVGFLPRIPHTYQKHTFGALKTHLFIGLNGALLIGIQSTMSPTSHPNVSLDSLQAHPRPKWNDAWNGSYRLIFTMAFAFVFPEQTTEDIASVTAALHCGQTWRAGGREDFTPGST